MNKKLSRWMTALVLLGSLGALSPAAGAKVRQPRCSKHKTLTYTVSGKWICR